MRILVILMAIFFCVKSYSQSNTIYDSWYRIDDSTHKFGVQLIFQKNDSCTISKADIPTTDYTYMYASFKIIKDTLFLRYSDSEEVDKFEILKHNILKISYIKGKHVDIIDDQVFFRVVPQ
jgi:hypothetical protein